MSIREQIINGTYNKESSIRNQIINGTYKEKSKKKNYNDLDNFPTNPNYSKLDTKNYSSLNNEIKLPNINSTNKGNVFTINNQNKLEQNIGNNFNIKEGVVKPSGNGNLLDLFTGLGKTALTGANYLGQGIMKGTEGLMDMALDVSTSKANPYYWFNPDELDQHQAISQELIKKDSTHDLITNLSGDENFNQNFLDKGSLIKSDNLAGKVVTSIGQMLPSIATGGNLPGTMLLGAQSYGGGVEEAYNNGATSTEAKLYGLGSAATEIATEWITGGIPGTRSVGWLDNIVSKGLGQETLEEASESLSKEIIKYGYKVIGEGGEEALSEMINPLLKNLTYSENEKIDWNAVVESAIIGGLTGGILEAPANINNIKQSIDNNKNSNLSNLNDSQNLPQNNLDSLNNVESINNTNELQNVQNLEEKQQILPIVKNSNINKELDVQQNSDSVTIEQNNVDSNIFSRQVDEVVNGTFPQKNMLTVSENTPQILQDIGLNNLPITMTQRHLKTIMNSEGEYKGANYHDLGIDVVKQLPQAISNPLNILKSDTNSDSIVIITELADKLDRPIIASIKIDGTGTINDIEIDSNVLTSAYGRNNYDAFMQRNIAKGNLLYDIDEGIIKRSDGKLQLRPTTSSKTDIQGLQLSNNISSSVNNNTTNSTKSQIAPLLSQYSMQQNVENDTKNNIPELEKNEINKKVSIPSVKQNGDVLRIQSKKIANQINKNGSLNLKERSWIETSTKSEILKDKVLISDLDPSKLNYVVQSNKKSLNKANEKLDNLGYEESVKYVKELIHNEKLPSASDIALAQRVLQESSKKGDVETTQDLIMDIAILGTDLGQATQALSMIQRLTPEGQLKLYTKIVQRSKARGEKAFQNVEITPEMVQYILETYKPDGTYNQEDLNYRVEKFKQDIAKQLKTTASEKINSWRYLSMLGNPKTHIRNLVSNVAMTGTLKYKNAVARTLETIIPIETRTKTWKKATDTIKNFADKTAIEMKNIITGEAKYSDKGSIEAKKQIFKNKILEKVSNFNSNALGAEDWFFSKSAFKSTFQEYLTANGIQTESDIQNNPEIIEKAKQYAVEQAEIATFRQYSKLASQISQIERNNKLARFAIEATIPFKKTPINVAKTGFKYSPLGLIKNISYDIYQLKTGNIDGSQFIDNISQGLSGTSLTLLGYALAKAGFLSGAGDDDKEEKYDYNLGKQSYSLNIGNNSYSISWLSPVAIPLLVGANAYEKLEEQEDWNPDVIADTLAQTLDPLSEMSFVSSLTDVLTSYNSGSTTMIKDIGETAIQNYVLQFFPTLFSQFANTLDDKKRSTKVSSNSNFKFGEETIRKIMYKIPGLRNQLEVATDIWGNEKEQSSNIIERAVESFLAPYSKTKDISTTLDNELKKVYNATGETGVIPSIPYAYTKYRENSYKMSAKEYTKFKQDYGQTANQCLNELINSDTYKKSTMDDKEKMISNVYDYARAVANDEYFKNIDVEYENDILTKLNSLEENYKIKPSTYFSNKEEYDYAYKYPEKYFAIKQITSYDKYNKYKTDLSNIRDNTENDKTETINYINNLKLSIPQKAMLIKMYYPSFNDYNEQIINYINSQKITKAEKTKILTELGFKIENGRVMY